MLPIDFISNPTKIDKQFLIEHLKVGNPIFIQFGENNYTDEILSDIDELCNTFGETLNIRFYGHYPDGFDCNVLKKIPNVKNLTLNCLPNATNIEVITQLRYLRKFNIGVVDLKESDLFQSNNFKDLVELTIGETRLNNINLEYLQNFKKVKELNIEGHSKNIDAIGEISNLKNLVLRSLKHNTPLNFINKLNHLKYLELFLGGRENLNEIEENEIEHLYIERVRGLNNLSNIANFNKLKSLVIENQKQISSLHFNQSLTELSHLKIVNCSQLSSLIGLENLTKLNSLIIGKTDMDFDNFISQEMPKSLKDICFFTTKRIINEKINEIIVSKGYSTTYRRFPYE